MLVASLSTAALAADPPLIIRDPSAIPVPGIRWAKPDNSPPVKALVFCPLFATRDVYDLAEHMNLEFELIPTYSESEVNFDSDPMGRMDHPELENTMARVVPALKKKYDVIIMATFNLGALPGEAKYYLIKQVTEGTGLALFNQNMKMLGDFRKPLTAKSFGRGSEILPAFPWSAFIQERANRTNPYPGVRFAATELQRLPLYPTATHVNRIVGRYQVKKGRMAVANYSAQKVRRSGTGLTPAVSYPLDRLTQHEYFLAIAAKQLRWASKGDPVAIVRKVLPAEEAVERGKDWSGIAGVRILCGVDGAGPAELRAWVRDWDGRTVQRTTVKIQLKAGEETYPIPLDRPPAGEHLLSVKLLKDGSVIDWGASRFQVTSPAGIEIALEKDTFQKGDPIRGNVLLKGLKQGALLQVQARDSYGRIEAVRRFDVKAGAKGQSFALALPDPQGIIFHLEATLESQGEAIAESRAEFTIPKRIDELRFLGVGWSGPMHQPDELRRYRLVRQYGYEAILDSHSTQQRTRASALCDLIAVPYMIRLMSCDSKSCFTTDTWKKRMAEGLEAHARMVSKYGALGYSLGDEVRLQNYMCESPTCVAAFRKWLEKTYKTIEALNREWGSEFKAFDDITPKHVSDAKRKKNYVPSVDYMQHRRDLWVEQCKWCHDAILRGDPGARMGYEGARGYERWPELMEFFRIAGPYDWTDNDIVIDQHVPGTIVGNWIGNYGANIPDDKARYVSWRRLILGCNSQWWWTMRYAFNGDNTPVRRFAVNTEAFNEINNGLGKLILNSEMVRDPIALPHCPPSELVSTFSSELTSIQGAKDATRFMLFDMGLRHERIPMKQIVAGALERERMKVVLLPYHQAMSRQDADALTDFVRGGGTLIADVRPAIMDEHGKPLDEGYLDAVFGVTRRQPDGADAVQGKPNITARSGPGAALRTLKGELRADRTVKLSPGVKAAGSVQGVPICVLNKVGKGQAILLNFAMDDYLTLRTTDSAEPIRRLFAGIFSALGIEPTVRVTYRGRTLDGMNFTRWRNAGLRVVALDRYPIDPARDAPAKVQVHWPKAGYIYDVRAKEALGKRDTVETEVAVHVPKLYAWLPYEIRDFRLQAPRGARCGERVEVWIDLGDAELERAPHVFAFDVFGPDGEWKHYQRQRVLVRGPKTKVQFHLAHNAPLGDWKLTITEVLSGKTAEHVLSVSK